MRRLNGGRRSLWIRSRRLARNALSKDLLAEKDYGSEIALLRPAAASAQLTPELTVDLALAYGQMGRLQDANELLRTALRAHPDSLPLAKALSGTLVLQARKEEAAGVLEAALKQHPADLGVQLLYLRILGDAGRDCESTATRRQAGYGGSA